MVWQSGSDTDIPKLQLFSVSVSTGIPKEALSLWLNARIITIAL